MYASAQTTSGKAPILIAGNPIRGTLLAFDSRHVRGRRDDDSILHAFLWQPQIEKRQ
jgi:hypothetical protein